MNIDIIAQSFIKECVKATNGNVGEILTNKNIEFLFYEDDRHIGSMMWNKGDRLLLTVIAKNKIHFYTVEGTILI